MAARIPNIESPAPAKIPKPHACAVDKESIFVIFYLIGSVRMRQTLGEALLATSSS